MCAKMAGKHIVTFLAILALSKSFSAAKSTKTKLSVGAQISASNDQKDDVVLGGSDDSLPTDVDETKRCNCDKLMPDLKPDYRPMEQDQPDEFDFEDWPEKLSITGLPSALDSSGSISISGSIGSSGGIKHKPKPILQDSSDSSSSVEPSIPSSTDFDEEPLKKPKPNSSGSISISGSIGSSGGIKHKPKPILQDSSDSSSSIEPSIPSSTDFDEEPLKKPKPNLDFPDSKIPKISSESLESKPTQPDYARKEMEKPRPVRKQVEKQQSKATVTYTKVKKVSSTPSTKTTGVQGLTCPNA